MSFLDPRFEEYFHSEVYERARMMEAASCEGCMRACWIDTSSMFRTIEGFFETTKLTLTPRRGQPATYDEAKTWARYDDTPIVPHGQAAEAK